MQAMAADHILPFTRPFAKIWNGKWHSVYRGLRQSFLIWFGLHVLGEPRRALILSGLLAAVVMVIGNLETIAEFISMCVCLFVSQ